MLMCEESTKVVVRSPPLTRTTALLTKFEPATVSVKAAPPAVALAGERLVIAGAGLFTVKLRALLVPPPGAGFSMTTVKTPAVARSAAVSCAANCVSLTKSVTRLLPLNFNTDPSIKFDPLIVRVTPAAPTVALFGERLVIVGLGLLTAKLIEFDKPPPGAGLKTATSLLPAVRIAPAGS